MAWKSFWSRLRKPVARRSKIPVKPSTAAESSSPSAPQNGKPSRTTNANVAPPRSAPAPGSMLDVRAVETGPSARDQRLHQLQKSQQQLTALVGSLQQHMTRQEQRTEQVVQSISHLAEVLSALPDTSREQTQTLSMFAERMREANLRSEELANVLAEIPKATETSNATLAHLSRQIEAVGQADRELLRTLESVGQAVGRLSAASEVQTDTLKQLGAASRIQSDALRKVCEGSEARDDRWAQLVKVQNRRFGLFFGATVVLAAIALAFAAMHAYLEFAGRV